MHDPYAYLQEQECVSPSGSVMETSYASSDDGAGSPWAGLSSIARNVVHTINRSAKSLINELAELEYEARARSGSYDGDSEAEGNGHGHGHGGSETGGTDENGNTTRSHHHRQQQPAPILPLPWEICFQSTDEKLKISILQKEDEPLKEKILALSTDESVFTGPFNEKNCDGDVNVHVDESGSIFTLDDSRVMLIRRLLEIDSNLGHIHARVSGRSTMKEKIFWMNYFYNCEKLREKREKEINDQSLKKALHDDELDAELVGRPPASCTGFYPRTGKLLLQTTTSSDADGDCNTGSNSNRVIPSLPHMECSDGFVIVDETDI